jgi:excinuclease ABC subunit C
MKVIIHLRDEAHRFGLAFHRNQRSKNAITSALDTIPGIGEKTKTALLSHFKSVKRIKEASREDLEKVIGKARANAVIEFFTVN